MNLSSHALAWKPAHEENVAREKSASSFPDIAPTGTPIGGTRLLSLGQHATMGWKQMQQNLQQQQHQQQQTHFAPGVDSGWRDQRGASPHSGPSVWAETASGRSKLCDKPQHSRGGTWTDDHSRRSHTSTSTGTTSCTGTDTSHGAHPFATAATVANPTATFYMGTSSSHGAHPCAITTAAATPTPDLGKISLAEGDESSQHPYHNAMSMGHPPRKEQHAPTPHHPYHTSAAGLATTQQMRAGSGSAGGGVNNQYGWSPQQQHSSLKPSTLERDGLSLRTASTATSRSADSRPTLPQAPQVNNESFGHMIPSDDDDDDNDEIESCEDDTQGASGYHKYKEKKWLLRMNRKLAEIPVGELDPATMPLSKVMNTWAETKTSEGATMFEMWLMRAQQEYDAGNDRVVTTAKMYAVAVDAWARSGEGAFAAQRAESLLLRMNKLYTAGGHDALCPTTGIFYAVINTWAHCKEKVAPRRAEHILIWMQKMRDVGVKPDKFTFDTVIRAYAKAGGIDAAINAQQFLTRMHEMYEKGNLFAKPNTITYNVVINAWAKSGVKNAVNGAENLLRIMHHLHELGDADVKPNVVTYGAVIDSLAKSGDCVDAARASTLLDSMIQLQQSDPVMHADLLPNTYVFNTVIKCWAKSYERDAASKAEEVLVAMNRLHASGMPSLKPDAFTYAAVIDGWTKSRFRGAAARADQLLDEMEAKYLAGDMDLKPSISTYNVVIKALARSGEVGATARTERILQNMVANHRNGRYDDVPTTIKVQNGVPNPYSYT